MKAPCYDLTINSLQLRLQFALPLFRKKEQCLGVVKIMVSHWVPVLIPRLPQKQAAILTTSRNIINYVH